MEYCDQTLNLTSFDETDDDMEERGTRRRPKWRGYIVILGGVLVHLTLGTIYTFGNMTPYMTSYFRSRNVDSSLTYEDSIWIFSLAAMGQGSSVFIGGILINKLGPKFTTLLGSWISSAGVLLTYFAVQHSFPLTVLTYGAMFGFGVGIAYTVPMACAMKWLPERKGLVNGLVVAGFGGGAFIFDQIQTAFLNPENKVPDKGSGKEKYFDQDDILDKVPNCFLLLGGCYASMQLIGSLLLVNPPVENEEERTPLIPEEPSKQPADTFDPHYSSRSPHKPPNGCRYDIMASTSPRNSESHSDDDHQLIESEELKHHAENEKSIAVNRLPNQRNIANADTSLTPLQVLHSKLFYILWSIYLFNGQGIQFISTLYKAYGQTFIKDDQFLAVVGSLSAVCNGCGRIMWGFLADKFSVRSALIFSSGMFCILMLTLELTSLAGRGLFVIYVCLLFLSFSGNFALLPTATAKTFGEKYYGINYGMVFTASIITSPISAVLTSNLKSSLGWHGMFFMVSAFSFTSMFLSSLFRAEKKS